MGSGTSSRRRPHGPPEASLDAIPELRYAQWSKVSAPCVVGVLTGWSLTPCRRQAGLVITGWQINTAFIERVNLRSASMSLPWASVTGSDSMEQKTGIGTLRVAVKRTF